MQAQALAIPGCYLLSGVRPTDERGDFWKLFHAPTFAALGLQTHFEESYVSTSRSGTVRGLHFQTPPHEGAKLVCCLGGRAWDGFADLRKGSPTYGRSMGLPLSQDKPEMLYLPPGIAHGFAAHADGTVMLYMVTSAYQPASDTGVLWSSAGIDWWSGMANAPAPIVSRRDQGFAGLAEFDSPFMFGAAA